MKILKIFGVVAGIHLFALILIFANPGCSSTSKPAPQPSDTLANADAPSITVPSMATPPPATDVAPSSVPPTFNPDAPATYANASEGSSGIRFAPTRPNTPAANAVLTRPVENVTPATTYAVKPGDSLWSLQKKFHISLKEIAAANNLKISSPLHEGQKLIIPSKSPAVSATSSGRTRSTGSSAGSGTVATGAGAAAEMKNVSSRPTSEEFKYKVKPGESLGTIARKFDVRTRDLAVHNNISDPRNLRAGTELSIPGWQPTSGGGKARSGGRHATKSAAPSAAPATPAATDPNAAPNIMESSPSEPAQPAPAQSGSVPVIDIDEAPAAPKS